MSDENKIENNLIDPIANTNPTSKLSLEALILLINKERLNSINKQTEKEFTELKERQQKVSDFHKLHQAINKATGPKGDLDISKNEEIKQMLKTAKERGLEVDEKKMKWSKEERERLVESVRMNVEDLNVQNDMQLQTVTRLTNERYETYQMARAILKPLHDAKQNMAKAIAGR